MEFKAQRFQAVEINVPSGTTLRQFNFPDLPQLTGRNGQPVIIDSIVFYSHTSTPKSPNSGADVISDADLKKSFLTIYQGDLSIIQNQPIASLVYAGDVGAGTQGATFNQPLLRNLINVSWTKCYITTPAAAPTGGVVYSIGIFYTVQNQTANSY
jgi:hypothetical protein